MKCLSSSRPDRRGRGLLIPPGRVVLQRTSSIRKIHRLNQERDTDGVLFKYLCEHCTMAGIDYRHWLLNWLWLTEIATILLPGASHCSWTITAMERHLRREGLMNAVFMVCKKSISPRPHRFKWEKAVSFICSNRNALQVSNEVVRLINAQLILAYLQFTIIIEWIVGVECRYKLNNGLKRQFRGHVLPLSTLQNPV